MMSEPVARSLPASWGELWSSLTIDERTRAIMQFLTSVTGEPRLRNALLTRFAKGVNFRPQTLMRWDDARLRPFMVQHALRGFGALGWTRVFDRLFLEERREHCECLRQSLNLPANDPTGRPIPLATPLIEIEAATAAIEHVLSRFEPHDVYILVAWLCLGDPSWSCLGEAWSRCDRESHTTLAAAPLSMDKQPAEAVPDTHCDKGPIERQLEDFTTLDRVLIDQVIATISRTEGSLSHEQIEDLLETVIALNNKRVRSNFHLGFMDAVVPRRTPDFDRIEFNDERRAWYIVGVLFGYMRIRDGDAIRRVLIERAEEFRRAAAAQRAGDLMARSLLADLVDLHRIGEAAWLVECNASSGLGVARPALAKATELLRRGDVADAAALLRPLERKFEPAEDDDAMDIVSFLLELPRRSAQVYQAQGDFGRAEALLITLVDDLNEADQGSALADLGLVSGRIRRVYDLSLPHSRQEREDRIAALAAGERYYTIAAADSPQHAIAATIALGMRCYLQWSRGAHQDDELRDKAIDWLRHTLTGMRGSTAAATYEQSGLLGQTLFMLAVLLMHRLNPIDAAAALDAWAEITPAAGTFPLADLKAFLDAAEVAAESKIATIAETIWRYRTDDAVEIVSNHDLLGRSRYLRDEVAKRAGDGSASHAERLRLWFALVPALLRARDRNQAEQGLDEMERLCDSPPLEREMLSFLGERKNYDPAWDEYDALWARTRLARRLGDDVQATHYLHQLFYLVRDEKPDEAADIVELFREWRLDADFHAALAAALPIREPSGAAMDLEERLRDGDPVKVLFVGGNEVQERYDATIHQKLRAEYPGLEITFRHTGWSSNWGTVVDSLVRQANTSDAVVLMTMMRTMLGRTLRARLETPWVSCSARGEQGLRIAIHKAALIGLRTRRQKQSPRIAALACPH